jgi:cytosine/adenosine deaminase-related metal-dependent hydrolase
MTASMKNGKLTIIIDADEKASKPSASGKTRIVASTNGNQVTEVLVDGKPVIIGLNAYVKP